MTSPLAVLSVLSLVGTALTPTLATRNPLLLVALSPRSVFVLGAASAVPAVPLLVVAALRLMVADPFHYRLGRLYGSGVAGRLGRWLPRAGAPLVAASPTGKVLALAGAAGTPAARVAAADVVGTVARLVALIGAGRAVGQWVW